MLAKVLSYLENPTREEARLRGAQRWVCRRELFWRLDLGKVGNVSSPEGFTANLRVGIGEQNTAKLLANFGGQRCSVERAWVHRSELGNGDAVVAALSARERGGREGMSVSRSSRTLPWRSCTTSALSGGARSDERAPNGEQVLPPVSHDGGQSSPSRFSSMSDRATLTAINSQTIVN